MRHLKQTELSVYFAIALGIPYALHFLTRWMARFRPRPAVPMTEPPSVHGKTTLLVLILLVPMALYWTLPRPTAVRQVDLVDDGILLCSAEQMDHGKMPYRDIYFHYGPLREIVQSRQAFATFGKSVEGLRRFYWWVEPLGALGVYFLALLVLRRKWIALLLPYVFLGRLDLTISERVVFPTLILLLVVLNEKTMKHRLWLVLAGIVSVGAYFYSMEGGLLTTTAVGLYFFSQGKEGIDQGKAFALGILLVVLPLLAGFWMKGILGAFFDNLFLAGPFLAAAGKPAFALVKPLQEFLHHPGILFAPDGVSLRLWMPVFIYMLGLFVSLREEKGYSAHISSSSLRLVSLAGILHFVMAMGRADYEHWLKGTPLVWVVLVQLIDGLVGLRGYKLIGGVLGVVLLVRYATLFTHPGTVIDRFSRHNRYEQSSQASTLQRLGRVPLDAIKRAEVTRVTARVQKLLPQEQYLYVFSDDCLYYFLTSRPNATRYSVAALVWDEKRNQEVVTDLQTKKPDVILAKGTPDRLLCLPYVQPVADYILKHYRFKERVGEQLLFVPK